MYIHIIYIYVCTCTYLLGQSLFIFHPELNGRFWSKLQLETKSTEPSNAVYAADVMTDIKTAPRGAGREVRTFVVDRDASRLRKGYLER